jgi:phage terminase large subunit GpA-like protein
MTAVVGALRLLASGLAAGIMPVPPIRVSEWLQRNIVLVDGPHAGEMWSPEGAPYLVEPADCLSEDHPCSLVTIRKGQQTGASILALGWCLYVADREPANLLYAVPGIDALRDLNGQKLQPLIDAWQRKAGRVVIIPQTLKSGAGSTTYEKRFNGGYLSLANANSVMDLSSKTVKKGVKDEVSKWSDIPGFGDPETLFFGRFTAFRRTRSYKILEISTPEIDTGDELGEAPGHCRIDRSFRRSDQRFWNIRCEECGTWFHQEAKGFQIDRKAPHKSVYVCSCGHWISESERVVAIPGGKWVPTAEGPDRHPGFHIDAFISLMMSYEAIAEDFIRAEKGTERDKKDYSNLVLGLPFRMRGDAPDHVRLMERREDYAENWVPPLGLLLVAGADVQHSGIWVEVVAFSPDRQSWSITARFLEGDTTDPNLGAFAKLGKVYEETFPDAFGNRRRIEALAVDAGDGGRANQVYAFARSRARVYAIKGKPGWSLPAIGTPTDTVISLKGQKLRGKGRVWPIGTWSLKAEFYADLRKDGRKAGQEEDPPGYCHFGDHNDEPFFRQITAEFLSDVKFKGRTTKVWKEIGPNHLLDCRIYAMAMAEHLGLTRKTREEWQALVRLYAVPARTDDLFAATPLLVERSTPAPSEADQQIAADFARAIESKISAPQRPIGRRVLSKGI